MSEFSWCHLAVICRTAGCLRHFHIGSISGHVGLYHIKPDRVHLIIWQKMQWKASAASTSDCCPHSSQHRQITQKGLHTDVKDLAGNRSNLNRASQTWSSKPHCFAYDPHISRSNLLYHCSIMCQFGETCFPQQTSSQEGHCSPLQMSLLYIAAFLVVYTHVQWKHASLPVHM